jgi:apolipoprotein N-acyltransferase
MALRVGAGLALAGVSGLLLTLAFPPYDLWPLAWIGFVPAVVAQHRIMPPRLSGLAYGVGFGAYFWGYYGPMFAGTVWFMEWLPLIVLVVATVLSGGDRAFHERTGYRLFVLNGAVVWVGIEAIRGFLPMIGTGGFMAYTLYSQPWFIQPVGLFSIYGLSLLIMLVNYAVALGVLALLDRRGSLDPAGMPVAAVQAGRWLAGVAAGVVLWAGLSLALFGQANSGEQVRVAALSPGWVGAQLAPPELMAQTREAAAQGAQLVVWPEGAISYDPQTHNTAAYRTLAAETEAYLALGYGVRIPAGLRNEATLLAPDGQFLGVYAKDHPVVWLGEQSITNGTYPVYQTRIGTVGTIICYDLNFTDTARKVAAGGAQINAVPSQDWLGLAPKQYTSLVFRAVENRVALVKADFGLDSVIVAPTGEIVARAVSSEARAGILAASVPLGRADAPLIRLGDWVGWLAIAGTILFAFMGPLTARRVKRAGPITPGAPPAPVPPEPIQP